MARLRGAQCGVLMQQLGRLFLQGSLIGSSEGELLDRFVRGRDESAFEALVARHGPMVLSVCRQLLRDPNDVDDAFQATFLVLVRKAGTLRRCDLLGNWLYGVAYRVALSCSQPRRTALGSIRVYGRDREPGGPGLDGKLESELGRLDEIRVHALASPRSELLARKVPDAHRSLLFRGVDSRRGRQPAGLAAGHRQGEAIACSRPLATALDSPRSDFARRGARRAS